MQHFTFAQNQSLIITQVPLCSVKGFLTWRDKSYFPSGDNKLGKPTQRSWTHHNTLLRSRCPNKNSVIKQSQRKEVTFKLKHLLGPFQNDRLIGSACQFFKQTRSNHPLPSMEWQMSADPVCYKQRWGIGSPICPAERMTTSDLFIADYPPIDKSRKCPCPLCISGADTDLLTACSAGISGEFMLVVVKIPQLWSSSAAGINTSTGPVKKNA